MILLTKFVRLVSCQTPKSELAKPEVKDDFKVIISVYI